MVQNKYKKLKIKLINVKCKCNTIVPPLLWYCNPPETLFPSVFIFYREVWNRKSCSRQQTWPSTARLAFWRLCSSSRLSLSGTSTSADRVCSADTLRPTAPNFPARTLSPGNPPSPPCTPGRCSGSSTGEFVCTKANRLTANRLTARFMKTGTSWDMNSV